MTPAQIRDYATAASLQSGINPAVTLGLIEHGSSYGTRYDRGGKLGLMTVPAKEIGDKAAYLANPKAQIDSGILRLASLKGGGTDLAGMVAYTGDAKNAMKALMRGLKMTTEPVSRAEMQAAYQLTGSRGKLEDDAAKYGMVFDEPQAELLAPQVQPQAQEPQPFDEPMQTAKKSDGWAEDSTDDDVASRLFDVEANGTDTPDDVWKQIQAIGVE